ncbi:MAG: hypothetical protein WDO19_03875 [Bacteroidota bacterium]
MSKDQEEIRKYAVVDGSQEISYSEKYFDTQVNDVDRFHLFAGLFEYLDHYGLITLVNKPAEMDAMELLFMKSKNAYTGGLAFDIKNKLADLQVILFNHYLERNNHSIEKVIESFINDHLNQYFNVRDIRFKLPRRDSIYLEKIRLLAPEFESLLKQYQTYVDEGRIDFDLIAISFHPLWFDEIKSNVAKKYVYPVHNEIYRLQYLFCSDQSPLYYVEEFKNKYENLYDLLKNEQISIDAFKEYQQDIIKQLIAQEYLFVDSGRRLRFKKNILLFLVHELNKTEVISYWYFPEAIRKVIDEMADAGYLKFENRLFTAPEVDFFNFYLNKKEFTNGMDLRNKYMHGTNNSADTQQKMEYFILLKLIILTLLKIEDDLFIQSAVSDKGTAG